MIRSIFRAAVGRFTLAAAIVFATVLGLIAISEPRGLSFASLAVVGLELAMLTVGYVTTLIALRPRKGGLIGSPRSHAFAGILAPLGLAALSPFAQGTNLPGIIALSVGTGAVAGLLHRAVTGRTPRPPHATLEELEAAADAELARLEALPATSTDVLPTTRPEKIPVKPAEQVA